MIKFEKIVYQSKRFLKRNVPAILTIAGSVGVVATSVLTAKATIKATRIIDEMEKDEEDISIISEIKAVAPLYAPAVGIGIATITCIVGSNCINQKQQQALIGAYALMEKSYKNYRTAANEVYGEDADKKIQAQMAQDVYIHNDGFINNHDLPVHDGEKVLFFDFATQTYFTSTIEQVQQAEYHINRNLSLRGAVDLDEWCSFLGIEPIDGGEETGWGIDDMYEETESCWLDFDHQLTKLEDGMECYIITASSEPRTFL